jgi:hypothetical protein
MTMGVATPLPEGIAEQADTTNTKIILKANNLFIGAPFTQDCTACRFVPIHKEQYRAKRLIAPKNKRTPSGVQFFDRCIGYELFLDRLLVEEDFLRGTFSPFCRASDKPIAIACLRLVTFLPERPLLSWPLFCL